MRSYLSLCIPYVVIKTAERRFGGQGHEEKSNLYSFLHFWKWILIEVWKKRRAESALPNVESWNWLEARST